MVTSSCGLPSLMLPNTWLRTKLERRLRAVMYWSMHTPTDDTSQYMLEAGMFTPGSRRRSWCTHTTCLHAGVMMATGTRGRAHTCTARAQTHPAHTQAHADTHKHRYAHTAHGRRPWRELAGEAGAVTHTHTHTLAPQAVERSAPVLLALDDGHRLAERQGVEGVTIQHTHGESQRDKAVASERGIVRRLLRDGVDDAQPHPCLGGALVDHDHVDQRPPHLHRRRRFTPHKSRSIN